MKNYAMILQNRVIDVLKNQEVEPYYPPDPSGNPVTAIPCDETVTLGMIYDPETVRFLYKGIIIKHNKTEPTYTKTSLFLCEKRRFFMARTEKGVVATI